MSRPASPASAYSLLLERYGPQGWWPTTPPGASEPVYEPGRARALSERELVEVCVGAILTQNTNWGNVVKALSGLRRVLPRPAWEGLAGLPAPRLAAAIRPSGYYRQKARKLKIFARAALAAGAGAPGGTAAWLASGSVEERRAELLGLWGVGPETADSVILYAAARPAFVVDAYTRRVGERLGWYRAPSYDEARAFLVRRLPQERAVYAEFHALLVRLAKEHCRARPTCPGCPLRRSCALGRGAGAGPRGRRL